VAARRLIFVMLALLVVSTFAATFAAQQQSDTGESTAEDAPGGPDGGRALGPPVELNVNAAGEGRERMEVPLDRRLSLDVTSARADLVSIPRLGLVEDVAAGSPAHFDLLISERGTYAVRLVDAGRTVATLDARDGDADREGKRPKNDGGEKHDSGD
jgi:hypothetical protein